MERGVRREILISLMLFAGGGTISPTGYNHAANRAVPAERAMHLPHLGSYGKAPIVFLTTCTHGRQPLLANSAAHTALVEIWKGSAVHRGWLVGHYVVMPDHVHLFAWPDRDARSLASWTRVWKSMVATRVNRTSGRRGALWQADYFDRYLRSVDDYARKWEYVALNPVRMGLVANAEDWPYRGIIHDIQYRASRG